MMEDGKHWLLRALARRTQSTQPIHRASRGLPLMRSAIEHTLNKLLRSVGRAQPSQSSSASPPGRIPVLPPPRHTNNTDNNFCALKLPPHDHSTAAPTLFRSCTSASRKQARQRKKHSDPGNRYVYVRLTCFSCAAPSSS